ncbi:hypothetical protein FDUTEX481_06038 [Tolypothrix sp. PCC 7601]|nr:hypothetical protein FDUTEX481_06038 [Tolypothrix sp. PCC 7601]
MSVKGKRGREKGARKKPLTLTLSPAQTLRVACLLKRRGTPFPQTKFRVEKP